MPLQAQLRRKLQGHENLEEKREGGSPQKNNQIFYAETARRGKGYPKSSCPPPGPLAILKEELFALERNIPSLRRNNC